MTIQLTNAEPTSRRARQYSDCERAQIRDLVEELLQNNIIRESNSPYASSVLLVKKKTGEYRLCIDYRPLNKITVKDKYPLPLIEEQLRRLSGFRYFTTLDLFSGYYHIPMAPESVPLTAFITQDGHYEFLRMPFGLTNAPAVFMRMVNSVLGQLRFTKVLCYLDDILIPARSVDETMSILRRVLEIFRANGLTLKLSKCSFLQTSIEYLGYEISGSEIRPTSHKIKAVRDFPVPTDVHRVRQFLGLTGYFRKFINDYAAVSRPLTSLLQKEAPWVWGQAQNTSFEALKTHLISDPVLTLFNPDLEIRLYTDASCLGVAGILIQINGKKENVISYFSKHTTANERKFHSFELEALAIVSSVRRFRQYLLGRSFTIVTDCAAVRNAFSKGEVNARIGRWVLELSEYRFTIVHRSNLQMRHVDALSRNLPISEHGVHLAVIDEIDWLLSMQQSDDSIQHIKQLLESGDRDSNSTLFCNYALKGGKVYKITGRGLRCVLPKTARFQILRMSHDDSGHFGFDKTYDLVSSQYWFKGMRLFVRKYVNNCLNCLYFKLPGGKRPGGLYLKSFAKLRVRKSATCEWYCAYR
jgi:hypothetical protein